MRIPLVIPLLALIGLALAQNSTNNASPTASPTASGGNQTSGNGTSGGNSTVNGNSTSNGNSTANHTTTSISPLPTATQSLNGGGSAGAPSPGLSNSNGAYGPPDSYISSALSLSTDMVVVVAAGISGGLAIIFS